MTERAALPVQTTSRSTGRMVTDRARLAQTRRAVWSATVRADRDVQPVRAVRAGGRRRRRPHRGRHRGTAASPTASSTSGPNRLAHHLAAAGVGAGDHVGLHLLNGTEYIEAHARGVQAASGPGQHQLPLRRPRARAPLRDDGPRRAGRAPPLRRRGRRAARCASPTCATCVVVDDDSGDDVPRRAGRATTTPLAGASPARDFTGRSSDDVYCACTGGTTGMPKGVMWRHEDIFFASMGGGDPMQFEGPIRTPEELDRAASPRWAWRMLVTPPLMHVSAHWAVVPDAVRRRQGRDDRRPARSTRPSPGTSSSPSRCNIAVIVGNAMAAPLHRPLPRAPGRRLVDDGLRLRRRRAVARGEAAHARGAAERPRDGRLRVDRDRRGRHRRVAARPTARRPARSSSMDANTAVLDEHLRADRARERRDRQAGPPRPHPDRLLQGPGEDGGDLRRGRRRALGAARRPRQRGGGRLHPAARPRVGEHQHGRREGVPRGGRVGADGPRRRWTTSSWSACPTTAGASGWSPWSQPGAGQDVAFDELQGHAREHLAGYKVPRAMVVVDQVVRGPERQARLRLGARAGRGGPGR